MSTDLAALEQQIAAMIGQQETGGGTAGVGVSLNNFGGLKWAPDQVGFGAIAAPSGFSRFPSLEQGKAATLALVDKYIRSGSSLSTLINGWAPPSDNNANNPARIAQLAQATGLNPQLPIAGQATAPSSGSSGSSGAVGGVQGAWDSVFGVNGGKGLDRQVTEDAAGLFPWGRTAAGVCGLICLGVGLLMLSGKGQVIIQEFGKGLKDGAMTATAA